MTLTAGLAAWKECRCVLRKDWILEALQSLCGERLAQSSALHLHSGFSAEDVAKFADFDRTNASRHLNLLAQEGKVERIPGPPCFCHQTR